VLEWKEINGAWYCYKNGSMVKGWIRDGNMWYYLYPNETVNYGITYPMGAMAIDWVELDSKWYYFYPNKTVNYGITYPKGAMTVDWTEINSRWYYFYPNKTVNYGITYPMGAMAVDWVELKSKWYYFIKEKTEYNGTIHSKGEMVSNTTITINNKSYTFDANGAMQEGSDGVVSDDCINFIKGYEIFHPEKYDDGTGVITQGYGCIKDEIADWGDLITEPEASARLIELLNNNYSKPIKEDLDSKGISLTQNQFDAIVSCAYNIGTGGFLGSTLYKYIVSGGRDAGIIENDFCMWDKGMIHGKLQVMPGLHVRRIAESNIFNYGIYDSTH
jgi:lysozyme